MTHTPHLTVTGRCHCGAVHLRALIDRSRVFVCHCADCQGLVTLRVGVLDQRAELAPVAQLWQRSALPWVQDLHGVPGCAQQELLQAR